MTRKQDNAKKTTWKELMAEQEDFLRPLVQEVAASSGSGDGRGVRRREREKD
jgi:hypothetical protein